MESYIRPNRGEPDSASKHSAVHYGYGSSRYAGGSAILFMVLLIPLFPILGIFFAIKKFRHGRTGSGFTLLLLTAAVIALITMLIIFGNNGKNSPLVFYGLIFGILILAVFGTAVAAGGNRKPENDTLN
jgi:chromate transport protein ChrA